MDFAGLPILIPLKKSVHVLMSVFALAPPQRLNSKHCQALRSPRKDGIFTQGWDVPKLPSGLIGARSCSRRASYFHCHNKSIRRLSGLTAKLAKLD
jgi:hypothetical protein